MSANNSESSSSSSNSSDTNEKNNLSCDSFKSPRKKQEFESALNFVTTNQTLRQSGAFGTNADINKAFDYSIHADLSLSGSWDDLRASSPTPDRVEKVLSMEKSLQQITNTCPFSSIKSQVKNMLGGFYSLFSRYVENKSESVDWNKIELPGNDLIKEYSSLSNVTKESFGKEKIRKMLSKLVVLKLNGGLGTTMGCKGPKSAIEVTDDMNFLDLVVRQIKDLNDTFDADVPLVLMNSFNTDKSTKKILGKFSNSNVKIYTFNQNRYPRIWKDSLLPMPETFDAPKENWYPPGHGDTYSAFNASGLLSKLISMGKEWVFIANIDNLGAVVDFNILNYVLSSNVEFIMELTPKTRADVKGGTLIKYKNQPTLLELAQVPSEKVNEFKSIKKFKVFNTNNLWVQLKAMKKFCSSNKIHQMDYIINQKSVEGKGIIQLETAIGAAIKFFKNAHGINVSRKRFLPVKATSDLFLIQSNLYKLKGGTLHINPLRPFDSLPLVKLGPKFKNVDDFMTRFGNLPNILELDHLTVSGDVYFGKNITLKGTVIIVAQQGSRIDIPPGTILENKIVSGNLRILDH